MQKYEKKQHFLYKRPNKGQQANISIQRKVVKMGIKGKRIEAVILKNAKMEKIIEGLKQIAASVVVYLMNVVIVQRAKGQVLSVTVIILELLKVLLHCLRHQLQFLLCLKLQGHGIRRNENSHNHLLNLGQNFVQIHFLK